MTTGTLANELPTTSPGINDTAISVETGSPTIIKRTTWQAIRDLFKTYYDTVYAPIGGAGDMLKSENLSLLTSYPTARSNLGLDTTANQTDSTNKRFMSDTQEAKLDAISGTNTGDQTITLTGDVTGSGTGSFATTIPSDTVTFAKMQNVNTNRILGRSSSGTGDIEALNVSSIPELIGLGTSNSPHFAGVNIGHATDTTISREGAGKIAVEGVNVGTEGILQNSKNSAYTLVLTDAGKHIYHPSSDTTPRTWTIPANSSVAFPIGTAVTFVNDTSAGTITITITTDTLVLAGAGTTGSRTLTANGIATALKVTATRWIISGTNLT